MPIDSKNVGEGLTAGEVLKQRLKDVLEKGLKIDNDGFCIEIDDVELSEIFKQKISVISDPAVSISRETKIQVEIINSYPEIRDKSLPSTHTFCFDVLVLGSSTLPPNRISSIKELNGLGIERNHIIEAFLKLVSEGPENEVQSYMQKILE